MKTFVIVFMLALSCAACKKTQEVIELPEIKDPCQIVVDKDRLYLVDGNDHTIHAYDTKTLQYQAGFGKKGEGPGEFKYPPLIQFSNDSIIVLSYMKTSWFTLGGKLIKEKYYRDFDGFNPHMEMMLIPISGNFVRIIVDHDSSKKHVYLLDAKYNQIKKLYEGLYDWNAVSKDLADFRVLNYQVDVLTYKNRIYISDSQKGFYIEVFNHVGDPLYTINRIDVIRELIVTEDYKQKAVSEIQLKHGWIYNTLKKDVYSFYDYFPQFKCLHISGDKLYVTTYGKAGQKHEIIVLDLLGRILRKHFTKIKSWKYYKLTGELDLYAIDKGRIYELVKNSNSGAWEILIRKL